MNEATILVMGVCGSGKSTVGRQLAAFRNAAFVEADDFHPHENVVAMQSGRPLTDADRWPWLDAIGTACQAKRAASPRIVVACSALKRSYRDHLRARLGPILIIHLTGEAGFLAQRMSARQNHFMPPALLDSQIADLEAPQDDEVALTVNVDAAPEHILAQCLSYVAQQQARHAGSINNGPSGGQAT